MKNTFDTIEMIESYLNSIPKFSSVGISAANFNLDRMKDFCTKMGNPEKNFKSIHVAGTNGKGTVCQMLASVYQHAGYKTALYTSPHLINVRERFKVNGVMISDEALLEFFFRYASNLEDEPLTFFELTTAISFWYFSNQQVDIAIIETGLGGRLDATNVIDPLVSVITSVGMDHADVLGDSISKIAQEKGGIIKTGKPVVVGNLPNEALHQIIEISNFKSSELIEARRCHPDFIQQEIKLTVKGEIITLRADQRKKIDAINAAVAYSVIEAVKNLLPVQIEEFKQGIEQMDQIYPNHAHFEKLLSNREWYFDGAHNAEAVSVLMDEINQRTTKENCIVVLSFMKDKLNADLAGLWSTFPHIFIYQQSGERAATIEQMQQFFPHALPLTDSNWQNLIDFEQTKSELVIFSGSFYFYEKVRRWMGTIVAN